MQIEGRNVPVLVEHMKVKNRAGFLGRIGKKMFGNSKYMKIIRAAVANRLNLEQMVQVKNSVCKGLLTNEILDIINSGFDAEEMELAVEIILAEKSYSMNEEYSSIEAEKESGKCF